LGLPHASTEPIAIVTAIGSHVEELRGTARQLSGEPYAEFVLTMGCLWGTQVCRAYTWEWVTLSFDGQGGWAVVSPDRAFTVYPLAFIKKFLDYPDRENTIILLFNMLADPTVPGARPEAYFTLA
jgi:hypothetical protein